LRRARLLVARAERAPCFPTGDRAARNTARYQPSKFAAMEGLFKTEEGAPLVIIGNPDTQARKLDSTIEMPKLLSFLTSRRWNAGLNQIPEERWPDSVPLVSYAYHIMVGLGTILLQIAALASFCCGGAGGSSARNPCCGP
jgi:cytochrome bd ubiquinol oxidase subunit I